MIKAKEDDLYLSKVSPLGVPFNNLRDNTKDIERDEKIANGKPGSSCPRRFLALSQQYDKQGICSASRKFQKIKIKEAKSDDNISLEKVFEKTCLCVGLSAPAIINNKIEAKDSKAVSICPGPNLAYFSDLMSLEEISHHIYGVKKSNIREDRPHFFIKELELYIKYLKEKIEESTLDFNKKQEKYFRKFLNNINEGISYYTELFDDLKINFKKSTESILDSIKHQKFQLEEISKKIELLKKQLD